MKYLLLIIFAAAFQSASAQIPGTKIDGPIKINDSITVREGDTLKIGTGSSGARGDFRYIYQPANGWIGTPEESLSRMFSGKQAIIKTFRKWDHKKSGEKIYTVINLGGINQVVELDPAIEAGEIIAINSRLVGPQTEKVAVVNPAPATSVADEIRKLKALYDEGIITKEEYEAKKKKLLEQ